MRGISGNYSDLRAIVRYLEADSLDVFVPRFRESVGTLNLIRPSFPLSIRPSIYPSITKTLTLAITYALLERALILGMCVPCDKTFPMVPCRDLDGDL